MTAMDAIHIRDGASIGDLDAGDFPIIVEGALCALHGREEIGDDRDLIEIRDTVVQAMGAGFSFSRFTFPAGVRMAEHLKFGFRIDIIAKEKFLRFVLAANARKYPEKRQNAAREMAKRIASEMTEAGIPTIAEEQ